MPMSQPQLLGTSKAMSLPQIRTASQPQMLLGQRHSPELGQPMLRRGYKPWPDPPQQQQQQLGMDPSANFCGGSKPGFGDMKQQGRGNWKGKKPNDKRVDLRKALNPSVNDVMAGAVGTGSYQPPSLNELQSRNHLKARKFYPKKFNNRFAPYAPRNTSSYIMRAKKSQGIASLVSPSTVTPAVLPTLRFSPTTEVLGDMAKEEGGVDGYGSMKGLIKLRNEAGFREHEEEEEWGDHEEDDNDGSSESDVEEEKNSVLRRLDHETSRFEMVYPNYGGDYNNILENRVDDQDAHIAQLEEENLTLKERLFLDMCQKRAIFKPMTPEECQDLKRKCGGSWKLVLCFLLAGEICCRREKLQAIAGPGHSIAVTSEGVAHTFGSNINGQLGHGSSSVVPSKRNGSLGLSGVRIIQAAAGAGRTMLISDAVRLSPGIMAMVKGKLSFRARVLQLGGIKKVFREFLGVEDGENLMGSCHCYFSTSAGPIAGLLFISTEKVAFWSERSLKVDSSGGESTKAHCKV
ncbi:hypothetical protein NL676_004865 [Syzygium grande]|nr:hypothetical protein NL676_004865 [Syzygium grande]